jgi:NAD-dependent deacetylase
MVHPERNGAELTELVRLIWAARQVGALTGAGISVASGIADFRSSGGLWSVFSPEEYATLEVFERNPAKSWKLFRCMGRELLGKEPNPAHLALVELERMGLLHGIVTQNIDTLHQQAGSSYVFEIHGEFAHVHCPACGLLRDLEAGDWLEDGPVPLCAQCGSPLKPNVVLFGESVRMLEEIWTFIAHCDLLLVIGTSAQVYPAAALPDRVWRNGGWVIECNREQALRDGSVRDRHFFVPGDVARTLPLLVDACRSHRRF